MNSAWSWGWSILGVLLAFGLALPGFWLLWRTVINPSVMEKMDERLNKMRGRYDTQQEEIDELRAEMLNDREELAELRVEIAEWRAGMRLVFAQLQAAGITPAWQPREQPRTQPLSRASRRVNAGLAERIARQFNRSEIDDLAYELGFVPEDINGETATAHARELTDLAWRRGLSEALAKRVIELRGDE